MLRIAFFEVEEWEKEYLSKRLDGHSIAFFEDRLDLETVDVAKDCEIVSMGIYSTVNSEVVQKMPKLKLVATRSTGFDHIDLGACKENNITVCNVPTYGENTVAEHTFALILSISRNVHKSCRNR